MVKPQKIQKYRWVLPSSNQEMHGNLKNQDSSMIELLRILHVDNPPYNPPYIYWKLQRSSCFAQLRNSWELLDLVHIIITSPWYHNFIAIKSPSTHHYLTIISPSNDHKNPAKTSPNPPGSGTFCAAWAVAAALAERRMPKPMCPRCRWWGGS